MQVSLPGIMRVSYSPGSALMILDYFLFLVLFVSFCNEVEILLYILVLRHKSDAHRSKYKFTFSSNPVTRAIISSKSILKLIHNSIIHVILLFILPSGERRGNRRL